MNRFFGSGFHLTSTDGGGRWDLARFQGIDEGRFDDVTPGDNFIPVLDRALHDTAGGAESGESHHEDEEREALVRHGLPVKQSRGRVEQARRRGGFDHRAKLRIFPYTFVSTSPD